MAASLKDMAVYGQREVPTLSRGLKAMAMIKGKSVSKEQRKVMVEREAEREHDGPRRKLTSLVFLFALLLFLQNCISLTGSCD